MDDFKEHCMTFSEPLGSLVANGLKTQTRRDISCIVKPGDTIVVREAHYIYGFWENMPGAYSPKGKPKMHFVDMRERPVLFECDEVSHAYSLDPGYHKRPALLMPKEYARTRLLVTDVREERLQDISEGDAVREGLTKGPTANWYIGSISGSSHKDCFAKLIDSVGGKGPWDSNPMVKVINYKKL